MHGVGGAVQGTVTASPGGRGRTSGAPSYSMRASSTNRPSSTPSSTSGAATCSSSWPSSWLPSRMQKGVRPA